MIFPKHETPVSFFQINSFWNKILINQQSIFSSKLSLSAEKFGIKSLLPPCLPLLWTKLRFNDLQHFVVHFSFSTFVSSHFYDYLCDLSTFHAADTPRSLCVVIGSFVLLSTLSNVGPLFPLLAIDSWMLGSLI